MKQCQRGDTKLVTTTPLAQALLCNPLQLLHVLGGIPWGDRSLGDGLGT